MDTFQAIVTTVLVTLVLGWLTRSASAYGKATNGITTVAYGWGFRSVAIVLTLPAVAALAAIPFVPSDQRVSLLFIAALFALLGGYLLVEGFFVKVIYSDKGIDAFSPWRKDRSVQWSDIVGVSFSHAARWHRIATKSNGFIRLHEMKSGVAGLLDELKRRGFAST